MNIAAQIKNARRRAKLSQAEAAQAWGVNPRTLQDWEQGRTLPNATALLKLLDIFEGKQKSKKSSGPKE
jgi:putative transcriptional regulator